MVAPPAPHSWSPARLARRSVTLVRREGLRGLWFRWLAARHYRRVFLLERPLAEPIPRIEAMVALELFRLERDEIEEYLTFHGSDPRPELEERFARGDLGFLARHQGRIVGGLWAARRSQLVRYLDAEISVAPDEVYFYDAYTASDVRGLGIAPALHAHTLRVFREQGLRRAVMAIIPENRANLRSSGKTGFRIVARWGYVRFGPWRRDVRRPVRHHAR